MSATPTNHLCLHCDYPLNPTARFCPRCGTELPAPATASALPFYGPDPTTAPTYQQPRDGPRLYQAQQRYPAAAAQPYGYTPAPSYGAPVNVNTQVNVQPFVQPAPSVTVINAAAHGPNVIVRLLWFLFIGVWLGSVATVLGYVLCLTIIGLPLGLLLLNRLPAIMTLRPASTSTQIVTTGAATVITLGARAAQSPLLLRALYFLLIGWWAGGLWLALAWALVVVWPLTVGLSLAPAFLMFDRLPAVMTLRKN